jgi:diaminopimelate decarboxylase
MLYQSDTVEPILLPKIEIGEYLIVQSCGAYNASMSMKHYNSYPEAEEILYTRNNEFKTIRKRQEPHTLRKNEIQIILERSENIS